VVVDSISATLGIDVPPEAIFAVLADPAKHVAIDGTGWVRASLDSQTLSEAGQIFRIAMHHDGHPDGDYQMCNQVVTFDPPCAISWKPGYDIGDGSLGFGGWIWRYDLDPDGPSRTTVTLTYDWSAVPVEVREHFASEGTQFPPFPPDHLVNSLAHLDQLARGKYSS
jgi:hypothetical protein